LSKSASKPSSGVRPWAPSNGLATIAGHQIGEAAMRGRRVACISLTGQSKVPLDRPGNALPHTRQTHQLRYSRSPMKIGDDWIYGFFRLSINAFKARDAASPECSPKVAAMSTCDPSARSLQTVDGRYMLVRQQRALLRCPSRILLSTSLARFLMRRLNPTYDHE